MDQETLFARTQRITSDPACIDDLCDHIANGGSFIQWCKLKDVRYSDIVKWMNSDDERRKKVVAAGEMQMEWAVHRLLQEIRAISFVDIRQIFNEDHSLKSPSEWPDDVAAAIAGIDVDEIWDDDTSAEKGSKRKIQIGETKKIKMADKLKALEMLGKDLGRFITKHEISGKLTLEDLVTGSKKDVK